LAAEVLQGKTVVVVDVSCANDLLLSGSILGRKAKRDREDVLRAKPLDIQGPYEKQIDCEAWPGLI
jgi:hypothetical protein